MSWKHHNYRRIPPRRMAKLSGCPCGDNRRCHASLQ